MFKLSNWCFSATNADPYARNELNKPDRPLPHGRVATMSPPPVADRSRAKKDSAAHSKFQHHRIFASATSRQAEKNALNESKNALLGQTIRPEVAGKYMDSVEFDGTGRISGFKKTSVFKKNLSLNDLSELRSAVIAPLTQTNTTDKRDDARPGRDCMIQFMHLLQNVKGDSAQELLDKAKTLWMSGDLSDSAVSNFFTTAAEDLADMPHLQSMATALFNAVSKPKVLNQHNDNMYGRKFDSEFVHALIKNPPAGTIDATRKIGQALLADFDRSFQSNPDVLKRLTEKIALRPWSSEVPDFKKFLEDPTYNNLKAMLLNVNHGFDILKVQYFVAKMNDAGLDLEWIEHATQRYKSVITPARGSAPSAVTGLMQTSGYGIGLANHPDYEKKENFESAKNITYNRQIPDMSNTTSAVQYGLSHGHATATGLSGSTNLLAYLSRHIASTDHNFSTEQAMLAGMMFLVFDGGHSLYEIMAIHTAVNLSENTTLSTEEQEKFRDLEKTMRANGAPRDSARDLAEMLASTALGEKQEKVFANHLENYHLDYREIVELAKHGGRATEVSTAMDTALGKTIEYFKDNSHYASRNEALIAQHRVQTAASSSSAVHGEIEPAPEPPAVAKTLTTLTELFRMEDEEDARERARDKG